MPYFKDSFGSVHFLDDVSFAHLLPDGSMGITDAEAATMQEPTPDQAKARKWEGIKSERDRRRFNGGVQVGVHWFKSDAVATSEYNSLTLLSGGLPEDAILRAAWRTMDGATVDMTPAIVRQILTAGFAAVAAIDDAAMAHKAAMEQSQDPAAYDYSASWPRIFGEPEPA